MNGGFFNYCCQKKHFQTIYIYFAVFYIFQLAIGRDIGYYI